MRNHLTVMDSQAWIATDSRVPDDDGLYLVYVPDEDGYDLAVYCNSRYGQFWHGWRYGYPLEASHWQPLPKKPRGSE